MNVLYLLMTVIPILTALTLMDISCVLVKVDLWEMKLYVKVSGTTTNDVCGLHSLSLGWWVKVLNKMVASKLLN